MTKDFQELGIGEELVEELKRNWIVNPTEIQNQAIPEILKGRDIIAQAQTGTGKTLAFLLPMMEELDSSKDHIQGLIITPTRELAIQITEEARKLSKVKDINILAAYGGQDVVSQVRKLKNNIHLVIGTPGRLLDHIRRESINFGKLKFLVLDEADEMLHMGFIQDIESIIRVTPKTRQTMLFSATIPEQIRSLGRRFMRDPVQIHIKGENITLEGITQTIVETTDRGKFDALCQLIDEYRPYLAIVFCRTKRRVSKLNEDLRARGYESDELHGDLSQAKRERVMKSFRKAEIQILVATDVAARGVDVEGVTHIFNYDIPEDTDSYIHRIGRTGRIGQTGVAITFVTHRDRDVLAQIERQIKMRLKERQMDGSNEKKNKQNKEQGKKDGKPQNKYKKFEGRNNKGFKSREKSSKGGRKSRKRR